MNSVSGGLGLVSVLCLMGKALPGGCAWHIKSWGVNPPLV